MIPWGYHQVFFHSGWMFVNDAYNRCEAAVSISLFKGRDHTWVYAGETGISCIDLLSPFVLLKQIAAPSCPDLEEEPNGKKEIARYSVNIFVLYTSNAML